MKKPRPKTLLEKALAAEGPRPRWRARPTDEELELALAWLSGKISDGQAVAALGRKWRGAGSARNVADTLFRILRRATKLGMVTITKTPAR